MFDKRGDRHYSIQFYTPKADKSLKLQSNIINKTPKKNQNNKSINKPKATKEIPNRLLSFTSHSSSKSNSINDNENNDEYYEDFLRNVLFEKKKSKSHKATNCEVKALKEEKMKKQSPSKNKKSLFEEKRKKKRRTTQFKLHLAEVQEEEKVPSDKNTIDIVHPQRNPNQLLSIKNEESFSINEIKKENKLDKVAEEIKLTKEMNNNKSKAKEDINISNMPNGFISKSKSPILTKDTSPSRAPVFIFKDIGASSSYLQENKSKKNRRQSVFDHHIGLRENSNNFDDYILHNINKKPRLSISPVRLKRDKMIKMINKKDNSTNDVWKNANWGQIPNSNPALIKKKSDIETGVGDQKKDKEDGNKNANGKKKVNVNVNQIDKKETPPMDTPSKQSSITKSKKKFLFCCIPIK